MSMSSTMPETSRKIRMKPQALIEKVFLRLQHMNLLHSRSQKFRINATPERFELSRGNPMYLAGTRLNHSAKASLVEHLELHFCMLLTRAPKPF
ncbi:hypothetical protein V6N11_079077 [Hibiscus sabdariffa]|uniref:Uncharacterized protein n=1 Tax=Hibiscus sabdariffa TaxID=183260 RepID=A0ABR2RV56_9ROSI